MLGRIVVGLIDRAIETRDCGNAGGVCTVEGEDCGCGGEGGGDARTFLVFDRFSCCLSCQGKKCDFWVFGDGS